MMSDDERTLIAEDADRTILLPAPGGQATVVMPRPGPARIVRPGSGAAAELQRRVADINPLLGAANVLLALVPQLRTTATHADPAGLRRHLLERIAEFEARAAASGISAHRVPGARPSSGAPAASS